MRSKLTEQRYIYGLLDSSETVTISIVDVDGNAVALDDDSCVELIVRGDGKSIYQWDTQNITTFPADYTEIVWLMSDGTNYAQGSLILGGFPDNIDATISSRSTFDASTDEVTTDSASREASKADVSALATSAELTAVEVKVDTYGKNRSRLDRANNRFYIYESNGTTVKHTFQTIFDPDTLELVDIIPL